MQAPQGPEGASGCNKESSSPGPLQGNQVKFMQQRSRQLAGGSSCLCALVWGRALGVALAWAAALSEGPDLAGCKGEGEGLLNPVPAVTPSDQTSQGRLGDTAATSTPHGSCSLIHNHRGSILPHRLLLTQGLWWAEPPPPGTS